MDISRFTQKSQEALSEAQRKALRGGQQAIEVEHLLAALLEQENGLAASILAKANVPLDALKRRVEQELQRLPSMSGGSSSEGLGLSGRLHKLLLKAEDEAKSMKDDYVSVEHLLLTLCDDSGPAGRILREVGVTRDRLKTAVSALRRRIPRRPTSRWRSTAAI